MQSHIFMKTTQEIEPEHSFHPLNVLHKPINIHNNISKEKYVDLQNCDLYFYVDR